MGIQLDWQVESERSKQRATEDPSAKHERRQQRRRLLIFMIIVAILLGGVIMAVQWRIHQVDQRAEDDLRATVDVELTALRIGNRSNFINVQRSASEDWMNGQHALFDEYQSFKQNGWLGDAQIIDIEVDHNQPRGRVVVEQVINDVPYRMVWFYWRYNDVVTDQNGDIENTQNGWRHVPPDIEFWGKEQTIKKDNLRVTYFDLDEDVAKAVAPLAENWWNGSCEKILCEDIPELTIAIVPESLAGPTWDPYDDLTLKIPSPLLGGRAPFDVVPSADIQSTLLEMITLRSLAYQAGGDLNLVSPYEDIYWISEHAQAWLISDLNPSSPMSSTFFASIEQFWGPQFPTQILQNLNIDSKIGFIEIAFGISVDDMPDEQLNAMDWTDFFQWRLRAEHTAHSANDPDAFRNFYDTLDTAVMGTAAKYFSERDPNSPIPRVVSVTITRDEFGKRIANVAILPNPDNTTVQNTLVFRWVESTWKRIN